MIATALEPAERLGLITVNARVEFRHPLIRSAAYHGQDIVERRAAHRALATALGEGDTIRRCTWHTRPSDRTSASPPSSSRSARRRSPAAPTRRPGTPSRPPPISLPTTPSGCAAPLIAGRALWLGGESRRAAALLESVVELATDPAVRADLQQLRCAATMFTRPASETYATLIAEAERVQPHDPARAADDVRHRRPRLHPARRCRARRGMRPPRRRRRRARKRHGDAGGARDARRRRGQPRRADGRPQPLSWAFCMRTQAVPPLGERSTITAVLAWTSSWVEEVDCRAGGDRAHDQRRARGRSALGVAAPAGDALRARVSSRPPRRRLRGRVGIGATARPIPGRPSRPRTPWRCSRGRRPCSGTRRPARAHIASALALTAQTGARAFDSYCALTLGSARALAWTPGARRRAARRVRSAR